MNTNVTYQIQIITDAYCIQGNNRTLAMAVFCERLNRLNPQLSGDPEFPPYSKESVENLFRHDGTLVIADRDDGVIVGIGILSPQCIGNRTVATIQNFVVDTEVRKQRIGTRILIKLFELAKAGGFKGITLTSNPSRHEAHALYEKFGFKKKDTGVYAVVFVENAALVQ